MRYSAQKVWANNSRSEKLVFLVAAPKESGQIIPKVSMEDSPRSQNLYGRYFLVDSRGIKLQCTSLCSLGERSLLSRVIRVAQASSANSSAGWLTVEMNGLKAVSHSASSNANNEISFGKFSPSCQISLSAPNVIFWVAAKTAEGLGRFNNIGSSAPFTLSTSLRPAMTICSNFERFALRSASR